MIQYILIAAGIVSVLGFLVLCLWKTLDGELLWIIPLVIVVIGIIATIMYVNNKQSAQGPCLKEQTSYAYNAATKTVMPYTYCAEQGTWVKQ